jgi:WD40 repeat protein
MCNSVGSKAQAPLPATVLRGHNDAINALCFIKLHDNPLHLLSGSSDGYINLWNIETRRLVKTFLGHNHSILSIQYHKNNNKVITFGRDGILKIWDIEILFASSDTTQPLESYSTGSFQFCNATCNKNTVEENDAINIYNNLIMTPSMNDGEILIWDMRSRNLVSSIKSDSYGRNVGMVTSLLLQSTSKCINNNITSASINLFAGYEDGSLSYIDLKQMKAVSNISLNQNPVLAIDMSKDGKFVMAAGADKEVNQIKVSNSTNTIKAKNNIILPNAGTGGLKYRCDGRIFVSAHWDNSVRIFQHNLKPLAVLRHHRESVFAVDFANYEGFSHIFATGSKDKTIAIWDNLFENTMT